MNQLLESRISPESSFLIFAYPFGRQLKCVQRYWLETAVKGAKKAQSRVVSQTTHIDFNRQYTERINRDGQDAADGWARELCEQPTFAAWNAVKGGNYYLFNVMFLGTLDDGRVCVTSDAIHEYSGPEDIARVREIVGNQLSPERAKTVDLLERLSRKYNPNSWAQWEAKRHDLV